MNAKQVIVTEMHPVRICPIVSVALVMLASVETEPTVKVYSFFTAIHFYKHA